MIRRRTAIIAGAVTLSAAAVAAVATGAGAIGDDDASDTPITGEALDRATAAALDFVGEGRVTETEVDDEDSKYEVEVTLDDGTQVDVQLREDFTVVGVEPDDDSGPDDDGGADD